ncbi:methyltransferase domain-containing protein [Nitrosomonas sp. JL21]|uniref:methyltransferase domain-containing protein n=1 Tax=Nitrosomonas sp. JL21 TaxID=153949 RepID=UPI00136BE2F4|nr:methyltransferase domain-containing protein [Nitrosomonas sp. JL21]MBL8496341.1 methyltransferase domain-containing protein [Nitrosomonas sp.]
MKNFKYDSMYYTGFGVQDLSQMNTLFPGKQFVQNPGGKFPFEDNQFDWIFSNAVIEHVGDKEAHILYK